MTETVPLTGIEDMKRQLAALPAEVRKQGIYFAAVLAAARNLQAEVEARAPEKTGALKRAIITYRDRHPEASGATVKYSVMVLRIKMSRRVRKLLHRIKLTGASVKITDDVFYWKFDEFGTSKQPARPFFRPAIDATKGGFIGIVGGTLERRIDSVARSLGGK